MKTEHVKYIREHFDGAKENIPLRDLTYIKLGGPARVYVEVTTPDELKQLIQYTLENEIPFFILGRGCNIVFTDSGYDGVIVRTLFGKTKCLEGSKLYAEAGVTLLDIIFAGHRCGLTGMEDLSGVPSSLGGAIFGNAGAGQVEIGDFVESVEVLIYTKETKTVEVKTLSKADMQFEYRDSAIKKERNHIVISAILQLIEGDPVPAKDAIEDKMDARAKAQPLMYPSAGCVFKNPPGESAGKLVQQAGLNGTRIGGMMISDKHGNFIVNSGGGTYEEYLQLVHRAQEVVKEKFGIELELEHIIIENPGKDLM